MKYVGLLTASFFLSSSAFYNEAMASKVAVIVSAGDLNQLEDSMKAAEKSALQTYEKLGFKTILIGGVNSSGRPLSAESLKSTLSELRGVEDLRLDFIGHGGLVKVKTGHPATAVQISKERIENSTAPSDLAKDGKIVWFASNAQNADVKYFGARAKSLGFTVSPSKPIDQDQIAEALEGFRQKNPDGVTTIHLLNCFSGIVAQKLRSTPNTIVYASAPHNVVALDLAQWAEDSGVNENGYSQRGRAYLGSSNALESYYKYLNGDFRYKDRNSKGTFSFETAGQYTSYNFASLLKNDPASIYSVGRSPRFESIIGWCEAEKPGRMKTKQAELDPKNNRTKFKIKSGLEAELKGLQSRFKFAENSPSSMDPTEKMIDTYQKLHSECVEHYELAKTRNAPEIEKRVASKKALQDFYKHDPKKPFRQLFEAYEKNLKTPELRPAILKRFRDQVALDIQNLKDMNLPLDRWGGIKTFINKVQNGQLSDDWIMNKLKEQIQTMRELCVEKNPFDKDCLDNFIMNRDLGGVLLTPSTQQEWNACENSEQKFDCVYKQNPQSSSLTPHIEGYWFSFEKYEDAAASCADDEWSQYQRNKKNIELDQQCVDDFISYAPESEWENLIRLTKLGERDSRGYSNTSETSKPTESNKGEVQQ